MKPIQNMTLLACSLAVLSACSGNEDKAITNAQITNDKFIWPHIESNVAKNAEIEVKVNDLLAKMTLAQKVAQMIQPEIRDISVEDMRQYGFGSYLNGGGAFPNNDKHATPQDWIALAEAMYQASIDDSLDGIAIPTMWGTDAVHGHNNVIGATLFPHNIGLGAANNPKLIEEIAEVTAKEVLVTGIDWVFAPTVATVRDDRWGRTYEGYSEDPEIVKSYAAAIVKGLQGTPDNEFLGEQRVISTVKHFIGDGGTIDGDDQGNNISTERDLFRIHGQGYVGGLSAGAQSVMASFNSWHGKKAHGSHYLLTEVLKNQMGFDGFVVGDWNGHGQVAGCSNDNCPQAVNAGLDMYMVPTDAWKPLYENTIAQVERGEIPLSRIDDAVSRILRVKFRAGLFDKPSPAKRKLSGKTALIGQEQHREVARRAVRESLVLLKNKANILPLSPKQTILVAGDGANNIGKQAGGWSITWQGTGNVNEDFPGATSIYQGIASQVEQAGGKVILSVTGDYKVKPDVAIVVFGENPYAEGHGDRENLDFERGDKQSLALLKRLKSAGIPVVSLFVSGRPMWVNAELNQSDAFVAVWLPGTEGGGIADVILRDKNDKVQHDFKGKLSYSWPKLATQSQLNIGDSNYDPLLSFGFGLTYQDENVLADNLDESQPVADDKSQIRHLFTGAVHEPWQLWLFSGDESLQVNANAHTLSGLTYRTVDKVVQEDAFKISFAGTQNSGVRLLSKGAFREDLRGSLAADASLNFDIRVTKKPTQKVSISLVCEGEGDCRSDYEITRLLKNLPIGEWQTVSVKLDCFVQEGMAFADTTVPFSMLTDGALEASIANIVYQPYTDKVSENSESANWHFQYCQ
ncbi:glycoside hydrolase family 3 protein [Thalassotalea fusca]